MDEPLERKEVALFFNLFKILLIWIFALLSVTISMSILWTTAASAERVLLKSAIGQKGQGWLFNGGEAGSGICWLVFPDHVTRDETTGKLTPVTFTDLSGKSGESESPTGIRDVHGAVNSGQKEDDLAFAPVRLGRNSDDCRSGLGLPQLAYETVMRRAENLILMSAVNTSYGIFQAHISRGKLDKNRGSLVLIKPNKSKDARYFLKSGLSGATAEVNYQDELYPFAMVLEVDADSQRALAIRFDLIKSLFGLVVAQRLQPTLSKPPATSLTFKIESYVASVMQGSDSALMLKKSGGCWRVQPIESQAEVSITLTIGKLDKPIKGLSVMSADCGSAGGKLTVLQRFSDDDSWNVATECSVAKYDSGNAQCYLDYLAPRQFKLILSVAGPVEISQIKLY